MPNTEQNAAAALAGVVVGARPGYAGDVDGLRQALAACGLDTPRPRKTPTRCNRCGGWIMYACGFCDA